MENLIRKIQDILDYHYKLILKEESDEICNAEINIFDSMQREFDELYEELGYIFKNDYTGMPQKKGE